MGVPGYRPLVPVVASGKPGKRGIEVSSCCRSRFVTVGKAVRPRSEVVVPFRGTVVPVEVPGVATESAIAQLASAKNGRRVAAVLIVVIVPSPVIAVVMAPVVTVPDMVVESDTPPVGEVAVRIVMEPEPMMTPDVVIEEIVGDHENPIPKRAHEYVVGIVVTVIHVRRLYVVPIDVSVVVFVGVFAFRLVLVSHIGRLIISYIGAVLLGGKQSPTTAHLRSQKNHQCDQKCFFHFVLHHYGIHF